MKAFEEPEILDGNNQYYCEKCGQHCDAHKVFRLSSYLGCPLAFVKGLKSGLELRFGLNLGFDLNKGLE